MRTDPRSASGTLAAVEYLADLGRELTPAASGRRAALKAAYQGITEYEERLIGEMLAGLAELPDVQVWGITDPGQMGQRVPTVSITHRRLTPHDLAAYLGQRGIFVWHGNFYALPLSDALGREPDGMVRIGLLHYNTKDEIDRLLEALTDL